MSRKYSSWASNQSMIHPDMTMMKLATVTGNEQDQLRHFERVEAIPHMYINVDAPPPPTTRIDARAMQPNMISRQNSTYFAAPMVRPPSSHVQTKVWPSEKASKDALSFESSSTVKRTHKHKHHHHHHHGDKQRHHHHHNRRHRARSAESIRNRQHQAIRSSSRVMTTNPQYIEQDQQQQQQQQQPMIVYREVPNGEGYTVDPNVLASVPYGTENETGYVDDQQAPMIVYRDGNGLQQQQQIVTDGLTQQLFYSQDQESNIGNQSIPLHPIENQLISQRVTPLKETQVGNYPQFICTRRPTSINSIPPINTGYIQEIERIYIEEDCCPPQPSTVCCCSESSYIVQQTDPYGCQPQQSSQIVYCTDPNQQDYFCSSNNSNIVQQTVLPQQQQQQQQQQQFVCVDNTQTTMQPTIINQIPVFNPLQTNTFNQPFVTAPQQSLQRATSVIIQQPQPQQLQIMQQPQHQPIQIIQQPQSQPMQIIQQPQQLQIVQQPQLQQLQMIQQPQSLQLLQQPQSLQIIQNPQAQAGQFLQLAAPAQQIIQASPLLQSIQMPNQAIQATPQILYQRPYDPIQNQQMTIANSPLMAFSQPSYAPARMVSAAPGVQSQGPNMFRHALLRTVADRTGAPLPLQGGGVGGGLQLVQPGFGAPNANFMIAGGVQRSGSLPIVPLTPGSLLIPFQLSQTPGLRPGPLPRAGGYPSGLRNFRDIQQQLEQQRAQLYSNLASQAYNRVPSPPVLSAGVPPVFRNQAPYAPGNSFLSGARSSGAYSTPMTPGSYSRIPPSGLSYAQPPFAASSGGSIIGGSSTPYR